jgi:flagellar basal-body rod protein FlgC
MRKTYMGFLWRATAYMIQKKIHSAGVGLTSQGYVKTPNVNSTIEVMDMREAQRSYSANLSVLEVSRGMLTRTIEAMR